MNNHLDVFGVDDTHHRWSLMDKRDRPFLRQMDWDFDDPAESDAIKYGSFHIKRNIGCWNRDPSVVVRMHDTSHAGYKEGIWNPLGHELKHRYHTAITGSCIWGKYDCMFHFKPKSKGNPGAERSLSSPREREDILYRIQQGQKVDKILISSRPFGLYQTHMIHWQAGTVKRLDIEHLYYALPVEEYSVTLKDLAHYLSGHCIAQMEDILNTHHHLLMEHIEKSIPGRVAFVYPMQQDPLLTIEQSYVWPYQRIEAELGIEEMEEVRIPYQAMKEGARIPPILLGLLGIPSPYYERRDYLSSSEVICLTP